MPSHGGRTVPARLGSEHVEGQLDEQSLMADLRLAKGVSFESIYRNAGIDPRQRMEVLAQRAKLMKAGAHLRTVPRRT